MHAIRMLGAMLPLAGAACAADLPQTDEALLVMRVSPGVSLADRPTIDRCNAAIAESAAEDNAVAMETSLTEPMRGRAGGMRTATLSVKIDYLRTGGIEPRSAVIVCTVAADGQVSVELKEG
jgi:hypothetical protein